MEINIVLSESEAKSAVMNYIQEIFGHDIPDLPIRNLTIVKDSDTDDK